MLANIREGKLYDEMRKSFDAHAAGSVFAHVANHYRRQWWVSAIRRRWQAYQPSRAWQDRQSNISHMGASDKDELGWDYQWFLPRLTSCSHRILTQNIHAWLKVSGNKAVKAWESRYGIPFQPGTGMTIWDPGAKGVDVDWACRHFLLRTWFSFRHFLPRTSTSFPVSITTFRHLSSLRFFPSRPFPTRNLPTRQQTNSDCNSRTEQWAPKVLCIAIDLGFPLEPFASTYVGTSGMDPPAIQPTSWCIFSVFMVPAPHSSIQQRHDTASRGREKLPVGGRCCDVGAEDLYRTPSANLLHSALHSTFWNLTSLDELIRGNLDQIRLLQQNYEKF